MSLYINFFMTKLEGHGEFTKFGKTNIYSKELAKKQS
jgi:hypothetical protein